MTSSFPGVGTLGTASSAVQIPPGSLGRNWTLGFGFVISVGFARGEASGRQHDAGRQLGGVRGRLQRPELEVRLRALGRHHRDRARDQERDEGDDPLHPRAVGRSRNGTGAPLNISLKK